MRRTRGVLKRYVEVPDEMCRSGMIRTRYVNDGMIIHTYTTGNNKVRVYGKQLDEKDFGTFMVIIELSKLFNNKRITGHLSDIAKSKGIKEPGDSSLISIENSINKLLDIHIRVRPKNGVGLSGAFHLVEGWIDSSMEFDLTVTSYLDKIKELSLGLTLVNLNIYYSTVNPLARAMVRVLSSHEIFYKHMAGRYYEISLAKLLNYLGYSAQGLHWYVLRPRIIKAIEECIRIGFLDRQSHPKELSGRDKKRAKEEGGIVKLFPAMPKAVEEKRERPKPPADLLCPMGWTIGKDHEMHSGCDDCEDADHKLWAKCKLYG